MEFCPKIAVIIPIYNGEEDLPELLTCLEQQTYPRDRVEYLLVDNNSRDRTAELLAAAAQTATLPLHPLSEANIQSSYAARNQGIKSTAAEILAFTDADCRPIPQWLERLVQPFAETEVGLAIGEVAALTGTTLLERHADRQGVLSQKNTLAHPFCPYGQTANLAVRRAVFEEVGLFRPYLTTGGDADICWRILRETAWQYRFVEDAIVQHRHRATLLEYRSQWQRYGRSNRYLHELHGVALRPPVTAKDAGYLISRWLLKELPGKAAGAIAGKRPWVDVVSTPLNLYGSWARDRGQTAARLPENARAIEQFDNG